MRWSRLIKLYDVLQKVARSPPQIAELMYLFGETPDNQESSFGAALRFDGPIGFPGEDSSASGYPGFTTWKDALIGRGLQGERIVSIPGVFIRTNNAGELIADTGDDARAVVAFARVHGLHDIVIVAPEFHLLRCFMTTVKEVHEVYPELRVHPAFGDPLPWEARAVHSQRKLTGTRLDLMVYEICKLESYLKHGFIASPEDCLSYIWSVKKREQGSR
jgi:hypothetical protein